MRDARSPTVLTPAPEELSAAAAQSIRAPIAALRASMETLVHGLDRADPRSAAMHGALDEVVRLGRSVQVLLDFALPQPVRPLSCSIEEIVRAAVHGLGPDRRERVLTAIEDSEARLHVDGPLLARCVGLLLTAGLDTTSDPVLVRARADGGEAVFALLGLPSGESSRATPIALSTALACREIARLGGTLSTTRPRASHSRVEIRIPFEPGAPEPS